MVRSIIRPRFIGRLVIKPAPTTATWMTWLAGLAIAIAGCASPSPERDSGARAPASDTPAPARDATRPDAARPVDRPSQRGTPEAAAPSADTADSRWDVDLQRDERLGGHAIARHVGRTDAQLQARLQRESISAASTYVDLEQAERVVTLALKENERRVQRWIDQSSPRTNLAIRYRARDGIPTGRMLRRGATAPEDVTGAVVVLRWRGEDWYVLTTYPENPR